MDVTAVIQQLVGTAEKQGLSKHNSQQMQQLYAALQAAGRAKQNQQETEATQWAQDLDAAWKEAEAWADEINAAKAEGLSSSPDVILADEALRLLTQGQVAPRVAAPGHPRVAPTMWAAPVHPTVSALSTLQPKRARMAPITVCQRPHQCCCHLRPRLRLHHRQRMQPRMQQLPARAPHPLPGACVGPKTLRYSRMWKRCSRRWRCSRLK
jgi:hypothetical protein